jgi:hypothetical protein
VTILDAPLAAAGLAVDEVDQYLLLVRDLLWRVLEGAEEHAGLKKRLGQLIKEGYPSALQLPHAYLALLSHLLKLELLPVQPEQMPNGATCLDSLGLCAGAALPESTQLAELGSLWMILGALLKNETLLYAGLKVALWQIHTLDQKGLPHFSLWSRAAAFYPKHLAAANYMLFTLAYHLTSEQGFQQAAQIQKHYGWDPASLPAKLLTLVPDKAIPPVRLSYRPFAEEMTVGMVKFTAQPGSMACTLSGWNSGLFSYHKNETAIVNCGPQAGSLDNLDAFGIERACSLASRGFQEMIWEKTAYHFRLKGWTKVFALPTWMQVDAFFEAQKLTLSCQLQENRPSQDLSMVFYGRCDQIGIGGKTTLQAGSLERYQAKSVPLELRSGSEIIFIEPLTEQEMQIIPLAGGEHFWGAHFLIAFPFRDALQFTIK